MFNEICKIRYALGSYQVCEIIVNVDLRIVRCVCLTLINFFMLLMYEIHFESMLRIRNTSYDHFHMVALIHFFTLIPIFRFILVLAWVLQPDPFRLMSKGGEYENHIGLLGFVIRGFREKY